MIAVLLGGRHLRLRLKMAVIFIAGTTAACPYGSGEKEVRWQEDVALADGSSVQIERYVRYHWQRSIGIGGGSTGEGERESRLQVLGDLSTESAWSAPLIPILLDRDPATGEFVIVATTGSCRYWNRNGQPSPPYWAQRLQGGQWISSPIPESFFGRKSNLFFDYNDDDDGDISKGIAERKRTQISFATSEEFKGVSRSSASWGCTRAYDVDNTNGSGSGSP